MTALPSEPISAAEFFATVVPAILAASEPPEGVEPVDLVLGVVLLGEGGGAWRVEFRGGEATVEAEEPEDAVLTVVQRVADWRGAIWEGRGGWFGERAAAIFAEGRLPAPDPEIPAPQLTPVTLAQLRSLDGVVRVAVLDEERTGSDAEDWYLDLRLGEAAPGADPDVRVRVSSADLEAIEAGEIDPFQALMGGRIDVEGDMALLLQLQAIGLQAAAAGAR